MVNNVIALWIIMGGYMKIIKRLNDKGSFTVEASIFFSTIFLIVVLFFHQYIYQFCFYAYRNLLSLSQEEVMVKNKNLYETTYVKRKTLTYLEKEKDIAVYYKTYNYLRCTHHYMMAEEVGDKLSEIIEEY